MTQFKAGDLLQVATMDDIPEELLNWAKEDKLEFGKIYECVISNGDWVTIKKGKGSFTHHYHRFKLYQSDLSTLLDKAIEQAKQTLADLQQARETLKKQGKD